MAAAVRVAAGLLCAAGWAAGEGVYQKNHTGVPWRSITAEQAGRLDGGEWSSLHADVVPLIPDEVFGTMIADNFAKFTEACAGLRPAQIRMLPPQAVSNMSPACLKALAGPQFAVLSVAQLGHIPAQIARFVSREQIAALEPVACGGLSGNLFVKELMPSACDGFTPACAARFTATTLSSMTPACVQLLPVDTIAALPAERMGSALSSFTQEQAAELAPQQCRLMTGLDISLLGESCSGLSTACAQAVRVRELGHIGLACVKSLSVPVIVALSTAGRVKYLRHTLVGMVDRDWVRLEALGASFCKLLPQNDAQDLTQPLCAHLSARCMEAASQDFIASVSEECVAALPPMSVKAIFPYFIPAVKSTAIPLMSRRQLEALTPTQCRELTEGQAGAVPQTSALCTPRVVQCLQESNSEYASAFEEGCANAAHPGA